MNTLSVTVIISTYNSEEWLSKVLEGYKFQTYNNIEIIVADDGSRKSTEELINRFQKDYPVPLKHIWHEDEGYRRQRILNIAIMEASNDLILFTDGDCIPRKDFVEVHVKYAEKGYFLSGGYCKLSMKASKNIESEDIKSERCFNVTWLEKQDVLGKKQILKLTSGSALSSILDYITPTNASFNNCNSSAWKEDLIAINGYDERMLYGGPDRELGERLVNNKIKAKQIRYQAICLHLDHARGYKNEESLKRNLSIRKETKVQNKTWTEFGIIKGNGASSSN